MEYRAFKACSNLTKIVIPDSVTSIGEIAFEDCSKLNDVTLSKNLIKMEHRAFGGCTSLESIIIPDSVNNMSSNTFNGCTALKTMQWSNTMPTIPEDTFANCTALTSVTLPSVVKNIGNGAFANCSSLSEVIIPNTVVSIGNSVFSNCDNLTNVMIPDSVTGFGNYVFYDCDILTSVNFGTGLTSIPASTFEHCDILETLIVPYHVASIGDNAFKNCVKFTSITIPRATTTIASNAFSYPDKMTIYGVTGTYAETFANANHIKFVDQSVNATEVTLNHTELTLNKGQTGKLTMTVTPANFTDEVVWKSTDTNIATIDDTGNVKAVNLGTATIKVLVGGVSAKCVVTVVQPVTSISLNKTSLSLEALQTYQLTATANPDTANNRNVTWSSSDESIATVSDSGLVTAYGKGTASLEVTFDEKTNIEEDFDYLYLYDAEGKEVGKYTGTVLAGKAVTVPGDTVKVKLVSDDSGNEWGFKITNIEDPEQQIENPFEDVPENEYYHDAVLWAYKKGITSGLDKTHFVPEAACTRGQVVTFLWRAKGKPEPKTVENPFEDVSESEYYYKAVLWAYENGITSGLDKTHFAPEETVTRGQFVTFLYRAEGKLSYTTENLFEDVKEGRYYYDAVLWAYENGVTTGLNSKQFGTEEFCTRGQVVTFLYRALK